MFIAQRFVHNLYFLLKRVRARVVALQEQVELEAFDRHVQIWNLFGPGPPFERHGLTHSENLFNDTGGVNNRVGAHRDDRTGLEQLEQELCRLPIRLSVRKVRYQSLEVKMAQILSIAFGQ